MINNVLEGLVREFNDVNGRNPDTIVVTPMAVIALALKGTITNCYGSSPVEVRLFRESEIVEPGNPEARNLGIFVKKLSRLDLSLVGVGLRSQKTVTPEQLLESAV